MKLSVLWDFFLVSGSQTHVTGSGAATLNHITCTGTGASHHKFQATGSATLNHLTCAGTGHATSKVTGSGAATCNNLTASGHGQIPGAIPDDDPLSLTIFSPLLVPKATGRGAALLNWVEAPKGRGRIRQEQDPEPSYLDGPGPTKLVFSGHGKASMGLVQVAEAEGVSMDDMEDLLTLLEVV